MRENAIPNKVLVINDENQLYRQMFDDLWDMNCVEEIPKICIPHTLRPLYKIHFSSKINRVIKLPFKNMWEKFYGLGRYDFIDDQDYWVLILNGALKKHYSVQYLRKVQSKHPNIKYALLFFDTYNAKDYVNELEFDFFNKILSFDLEDCKKYGFTYIQQGQVFSKPKGMKNDEQKRTDLFFVGMGAGRVDVLNDIVRKIDGYVNYKIHICAVSREKQLIDTKIFYNQTIPYSEELQYIFNTNTVLDVVKQGQSGITLRICEALLFNKKILTNNQSIREMPFYDSRFIKVFNDISDIDISFIKDNAPVKYNIESDYFSPQKIVRLLLENI